LRRAGQTKEQPAACQATRRSSSFTSTSLQDVHDMTIKGARPSGRGTVRTSFIMLPQEGQRAIARLSAKIMVANPKDGGDPAFDELIAESPAKMVAEKQRRANLMVRESSYFHVKYRNFAW
jgi:hypothetical protein